MQLTAQEALKISEQNAFKTSCLEYLLKRIETSANKGCTEVEIMENSLKNDTGLYSVSNLDKINLTKLGYTFLEFNHPYRILISWI